MNLKELTTFGIKVKQKLLEKKMTQSEFCERYKIPMNRFSEILYGSRPGTKYRVKIAEILGIEDDAA
jgi:transcriptional regulator with XRE-family HTH domain